MRSARRHDMLEGSRGMCTPAREHKGVAARAVWTVFGDGNVPVHPRAARALARACRPDVMQPEQWARLCGSEAGDDAALGTLAMEATRLAARAVDGAGPVQAWPAARHAALRLSSAWPVLTSADDEARRLFVALPEMPEAWSTCMAILRAATAVGPAAVELLLRSPHFEEADGSAHLCDVLRLWQVTGRGDAAVFQASDVRAYDGDDTAIVAWRDRVLDDGAIAVLSTRHEPGAPDALLSDNEICLSRAKWEDALGQARVRARHERLLLARPEDIPFACVHDLHALTAVCDDVDDEDVGTMLDGGHGASRVRGCARAPLHNWTLPVRVTRSDGSAFSTTHVTWHEGSGGALTRAGSDVRVGAVVLPLAHAVLLRRGAVEHADVLAFDSDARALEHVSRRATIAREAQAAEARRAALRHISDAIDEAAHAHLQQGMIAQTRGGALRQGADVTVRACLRMDGLLVDDALVTSVSICARLTVQEIWAWSRVTWSHVLRVQQVREAMLVPHEPGGWETFVTIASAGVCAARSLQVRAPQGCASLRIDGEGQWAACTLANPQAVCTCEHLPSLPLCTPLDEREELCWMPDGIPPGHAVRAADVADFQCARADPDRRVAPAAPRALPVLSARLEPVGADTPVCARLAAVDLRQHSLECTMPGTLWQSWTRCDAEYEEAARKVCGVLCIGVPRAWTPFPPVSDALRAHVTAHTPAGDDGVVYHPEQPWSFTLVDVRRALWQASCPCDAAVHGALLHASDVERLMHARAHALQ